MIQCPTCHEWFEVSEVAPEDYGSRMDYDCEICCRPLILVVETDGSLFAEGLEE
ncbi:MAG: CPXCG motif-containing cysteine-rich protein [Akkermansiaceae bacterium]|nr:CPXCG motif-containing cysteine-rich protein [Akkermansiaceae bacterium]